MSNEEATGKKSLKDKVKERVTPSPSGASDYRALALDALAALLHSDDETIRLQAAQALLQHMKEPEKSAPGARLVKKLSGGALRK